MSKVAVVTGASKGIGRAVSERLLSPELKVTTLVVIARQSAEFSQTIVDLREAAGDRVAVIDYALDVGDREETIAVIHDMYARVKRVDILVNNAGYTNPVAIQQVDFADFERTIAVNVYAPFTFVQELLHLGNRFKVIVNIASTAGINGRAGWLTYSASKAALINMSEVMRDELKVDGTRVICLSPGRTATDLRRILAPDEDPTTIMQPEHVAEVIGTMIGPVGRFIDQQNVVVRQ